MTLHIASSTPVPVSEVVAFIGDAMITGRTISDDIAASIASWFKVDHPVMARLCTGQTVSYDDFACTMLDIGLCDIEEAELICLDFLDEWATLKASEGRAA